MEILDKNKYIINISKKKIFLNYSGSIMSITMKRGFTLIELMVVISIIGMLSSIVLASLNTAREKAKISKARSELIQLRNATALMSQDTGLWPNGCKVGSIISITEPGGASNEVSLSDQKSGLITVAPMIGTGDPSSNCLWTAEAVNMWKGPYSNVSSIDPWGSLYWFDNDYEALRDCIGATQLGTLAVILSPGPNKVGGAPDFTYDCDDIFIQLY